MLAIWEADLAKYLKPRRKEELIPIKGSDREAHQQRTQDASSSGLEKKMSPVVLGCS